MKEIKKFIDIENLREEPTSISCGLGLISKQYNTLSFKVGEKVNISVKIDGSNFSVIYDPENDNLACFSRRMPLTGMDGLKGAVSYARKLDITPFKNHPNYRVYGEWIATPKHNKIKYNDDMVNRWIVYSIWDDKKEEWLSQEIVKDFCKEANLEYVEVLYEGPFISWDHCRSFLNASKKYGPVQEGIVVRSVDRLGEHIKNNPHILKIVNESFSEVKKISPEEKAKALSLKEKRTQILLEVLTQNRVEKLIAKAQEDNLLPKELSENNIKDIAKIIPKACYEDLIKEEPETIKAIGDDKVASKLIGSITMAIIRKIIIG